MSDPLLDELPILTELGDDLKTAFRAREASSRVRRWRVRPGRVRGSLVAIASVAVTGAVIAVILTAGGHSGRPAPAPLTVTGVLEQAATAAAGRRPLLPADNQFYYVRYRSTSMQVIRANPTEPLPARAFAAPKAAVTTEFQLWASANRTGQITSRVTSVRFGSAGDRRRWVQLGRPSFALPGTQKIGALGSSRFFLGDVELTRRQLTSLSARPRALYARLLATDRSPSQVFSDIGDILGSDPAPAALRSTVYHALALIPGIALAGRFAGATAVGVVEDGLEYELIFDPVSSQVRAQRTVVLAAGTRRVGLPAGTVLSTTTYLQRAVTNTTQGP